MKSLQMIRRGAVAAMMIAFASAVIAGQENVSVSAGPANPNRPVQRLSSYDSRSLPAYDNVLAARGRYADVTPPADGVANVRDFGAAGDGLTDDTTAIQSAVDVLAAGGIVYFSPGTYVISRPLHVWRSTAPLTMEGVGDGSVIMNVARYSPAVLVRGCNVTAGCQVSQLPQEPCPSPLLRPDCYEADAPCFENAPTSLAVRNIEIKNLKISHAGAPPGSGGWLIDICQGPDTTISRVTFDASNAGSEKGALRMVYSWHVNVLDSVFSGLSNTNTYAAWLQALFAVFVAGNRMTGSVGAPGATGIGLFSADQATLIGNVIEGFDTGIRLSGGVGIHIQGRFAGNRVSIVNGGTTSGLTVSGSEFATPAASATNHVVLGVYQPDPNAWPPWGAVHAATIFGNHFAGCPGCGSAPITIGSEIIRSLIGPNSYEEFADQVTTFGSQSRDPSVVMFGKGGSLDVASITIGRDHSDHPVTTDQPSRSVTGAISTCASCERDPTPYMGTGFSVTKVSTGLFAVRFTTPFGDTPRVVLSTAVDETHGNTGVRAGWDVAHSDPREIRIYTVDSTGASYVDADTIISFTAIGAVASESVPREKKAR